MARRGRGGPAAAGGAGQVHRQHREAAGGVHLLHLTRADARPGAAPKRCDAGGLDSGLHHLFSPALRQVCTASGQTYEREEISKWLRHKQTDPISNARLAQPPARLPFC